MGIKVIPAGLIRRQPDTALTLTFFDHAGHQNIAPQQEVVALFKRLRVILMIEKGRSQHRFVIRMRLPQQGIKIGQQAITQFNRAANGRRHARIHPRLVHRVIVIPRMNGETRVHHAVLYPANKQLSIRFITGEATHIVPHVIQPGQTHPQPHSGVETQCFPTGPVIAAPGLYVTLHPGAAGAGDQIRTFIRGKPLLCFQRCSHHQQRHHRTNMFNGNLAAKTVAACFTVPHFKLVVVIPRRVDAHLQQLRGDAFLPPLDGLWIGKVEVRPFIVPEA